MIYSCLSEANFSLIQILKMRCADFPFATSHSTKSGPSIGQGAQRRFSPSRSSKSTLWAGCRHISRLACSQGLTLFPPWPWNHSVTPDWEVVMLNLGWEEPPQSQTSASDRLESHDNSEDITTVTTSSCSRCCSTTLLLPVTDSSKARHFSQLHKAV